MLQTGMLAAWQPRAGGGRGTGGCGGRGGRGEAREKAAAVCVRVQKQRCVGSSDT